MPKLIKAIFTLNLQLKCELSLYLKKNDQNDRQRNKLHSLSQFGYFLLILIGLIHTGDFLNLYTDLSTVIVSTHETPTIGVPRTRNSVNVHLVDVTH